MDPRNCYCFRCKKNTFTIRRFLCFNCGNAKESMDPRYCYCFCCKKNTFTVRRFLCINCGNAKESMDPRIENVEPVEPESGRESPGCYVLASDASTQTNEDDFDDIVTMQDASTQTNDDDFPPLVLTLDASTQTTDSDFSCIAQIAGNHEYIDEPEPINEIEISNVDSCNRGSSDCLSQSDCQESYNIVNTNEDGQEIRKSDLVLTDSESSCPAQIIGHREYIDGPKPINDAEILKFDSCNRGLSDWSSQADCQEASSIVSTVGDGQEIRNSDLVLAESESSCPAQNVGYREYINEPKPINDVEISNVGSCNRGSSDCLSQSDCQESYNIVNTNEDDQEIRNSDLVLTDSESSCPAQIVGHSVYIDGPKPINDAEILKFDSCNRGLSDRSSPADCQDSSYIVHQPDCQDRYDSEKHPHCQDIFNFSNQSVCQVSSNFVNQSVCQDSSNFVNQSVCQDSSNFVNQSVCQDSSNFVNQSVCQDSSNIVNTLKDGQEISNNDLVPNRKRSNDSNDNYYERNDSIKRPFQEKEHGNLSTYGLKMQEPNLATPTFLRICLNSLLNPLQVVKEIDPRMTQPRNSKEEI